MSKREQRVKGKSRSRAWGISINDSGLDLIYRIESNWEEELGGNGHLFCVPA